MYYTFGDSERLISGDLPNPREEDFSSLETCDT